MNKDLKASTYDPNRFVDTALTKLNVKNDRALAQELCLTPAVISNIRHRRLPISAPILIAIHEFTELPIREIKAWWQPETST